MLTSFGIGLSNVLLGVATLGWFFVDRQTLPSAASRRTARLALGYLILLVAAIAASDDVGASRRALSEIFSFALLGLALVHLRDERRVRWLVDLLILVGTGVAIHGLAQLAGDAGDLEARIRGPFSHYMTFAGYLLLVDLLLVARLLARRERRAGGPTGLLDRPWVSGVACTLMSAAVVVSLTRSAWLALAGALLLLVALVRPKLLLVAPALALAVLIFAPIPFVHRLLSIASLSDASNYDRICMAEAGLRMVAERPLLGFGPDLVKRVYPLYRHPTAPRLLVPHLHNSYLQLAAERGIPELALYLALVATALGAAWRGFRRGGSAADLHLGVVGALVAFSIAGLFEYNWGDSEVQRVVLLLFALPPALDAGAAEAA